MSSMKRRVCETAPKNSEKDAGKPNVEVKSTEQEIKRVEKLVSGVSPKAAPFIAIFVVYAQIALPYIVDAVIFVNGFIASLPKNILYAAIGFAMCFFGGVFPATIAAVSAWQLCGGTEAIQDIKDLYAEFTKARDASANDDQVDENNDGIPDVDQISRQELVKRKTLLAMRAADPEKVNGAIAGLYTGWIGVLAILKIDFARTVTLGEAIGERLYTPAQRFIPALEEIVPPEYKKWVPVTIQWMCKAIAISIAWWIQRVISAFHSAISGGHLFSKYLLVFLRENDMLPLGIAHIDQVIAWGIAFLGFTFQLWMKFSMPFPFNILFLPIRILETVIVWSVNS